MDKLNWFIIVNMMWGFSAGLLFVPKISNRRAITLWAIAAFVITSSWYNDWWANTHQLLNVH
jgi:hypothetical protein